MVVFSADLTIHRETVFKLPKGGICIISGFQLPRKPDLKKLICYCMAGVYLPEIIPHVRDRRTLHTISVQELNAHQLQLLPAIISICQFLLGQLKAAGFAAFEIIQDFVLLGLGREEDIAARRDRLRIRLKHERRRIARARH